MNHYWIATFFSFVTACFTIASSWTKDPKKTYVYQVFQCLVYAVAAFFYGVYPCILVMLINALRNFLVSQGKYRKVHSYIFCFLAVVVGLFVNTSGVIGYITIFATVQYSLCSYYLTKPIPVKVNIIINMVIWFIYDILILDVFSAIMDFTSTILAIITIVRIRKNLH